MFSRRFFLTHYPLCIHLKWVLGAESSLEWLNSPNPLPSGAGLFYSSNSWDKGSKSGHLGFFLCVQLVLGFLGYVCIWSRSLKILAKSHLFASSRFHGLVTTPWVFPRHNFQTCFISLFLPPVPLSISQRAGWYFDVTRLDWEGHILNLIFHQDWVLMGLFCCLGSRSPWCFPPYQA